MRRLLAFAIITAVPAIAALACSGADPAPAPTEPPLDIAGYIAELVQAPQAQAPPADVSPAGQLPTATPDIAATLAPALTAAASQPTATEAPASTPATPSAPATQVPGAEPIPTPAADSGPPTMPPPTPAPETTAAPEPTAELRNLEHHGGTTQPITITGIVTVAGAPRADLIVQATSPGYHPTTARTKANGIYRLNIDSDVRAEIQISVQGYNSVPVPYQPTGKGDLKRIDFTLPATSGTIQP